MRRLFYTLVLVLLPAAADADAPPTNPMTKVPAVQQTIKDAIGEMAALDWAFPREGPVMQERIADVRTACNQDMDVYATQLISACYDFYMFGESEDDRKATFACSMMIDLATPPTPPRSILDAVVPHIDSSNPNARDFFLGWVNKICLVVPGKPADFSTLQAYVADQLAATDPVSPAIVDYMLKNPPIAIPALESAGDPANTYTDISVSTVADLTELLALCERGMLASTDSSIATYKPIVVQWVSDPRWWVRLYAAAMMVRCLDLLADPSAATLANDANPLVKARGEIIAAHYAE